MVVIGLVLASLKLPQRHVLNSGVFQLCGWGLEFGPTQVNHCARVSRLFWHAHGFALLDVAGTLPWRDWTKSVWEAHTRYWFGQGDSVGTEWEAILRLKKERPAQGLAQTWKTWFRCDGGWWDWLHEGMIPIARNPKPENWGNDPIWLAHIFQRGWWKTTTSYTCFACSFSVKLQDGTLSREEVEKNLATWLRRTRTMPGDLLGISRREAWVY